MNATVVAYKQDLIPVRPVLRAEPGRGYFFRRSATCVEPFVKRAIAFFDGQNLYHAAKKAFGYTYPNYDVVKLARAICASRGWSLVQVRFYTGVPDQKDDAAWHQFWAAKFLAMSRQKVDIFSRRLRYRKRRVRLPDGTCHTFTAGEEKGIDVRIAIDVIRMAHSCDYEVAIIFSQDQDLSEVADEVRIIAKEQSRWIKVASAFPVSSMAGKTRGIDRTDWIRIDRMTYDACIDLRDYRGMRT